LGDEIHTSVEKFKETSAIKSQARRIKCALIDTVNNYQYTKDDIDQVVQKKRKLLLQGILV
jgi:hypothetical protein